MLDVPIFLAAMGIVILEMSEAAAVALALYAEAGYKAFAYVFSGSAIVLALTFALGKGISYLPIFAVRLFAAVLLLYFGIRLAKSARRAILRERSGKKYEKEKFGRSLFYTGFSVGLVEAFEAAIVLVALIPINMKASFFGLLLGLAIVAAGTALLRSQVRKIKQASIKIAVSALLLSFSAFWFAEAVTELQDFLLVPIFAGFAVLGGAVPRQATRPLRLPVRVLRLARD